MSQYTIQGWAHDGSIPWSSGVIEGRTFKDAVNAYALEFSHKLKIVELQGFNEEQFPKELMTLEKLKPLRSDERYKRNKAVITHKYAARLEELRSQHIRYHAGKKEWDSYYRAERKKAERAKNQDYVSLREAEEYAKLLSTMWRTIDTILRKEHYLNPRELEELVGIWHVKGARKTKYFAVIRRDDYQASKYRDNILFEEIELNMGGLMRLIYTFYG